MKVLSVIGSRSQLIKSGAVSHQLLDKGIKEIVLLAGQQSEDIFIQDFFGEMDIPLPKHNLSIQAANQGAILGRMIEGIENVILNEKPDLVLVYGDSNSSLAGALAANKTHIPIAHIEAGLRSGNMQAQGELNRILTDRASNILLCPSAKAVDNLNDEGLNKLPYKTYYVGDLLMEVIQYYSSISAAKTDIMDRLSIKQSYALATIGRQEYFDDLLKLKEIVIALNVINRDQQVIVPLHQSRIKYLRDLNMELSFKIVPYLNYFDMVELIKSCNIVITDNSEVQREAFYLGKSSVAIMHETEWPELIQNGYSMLGSLDSEFMLIAYHEMISRKPDFGTIIYGKEKASAAIAEIIKHWQA